MDKFKDVKVDTLANIYFQGNVYCRNIFLKDGSRKNSWSDVIRYIRI